MKKAIPVLIAIVLIFIIVGVSFGTQIYEKYSYSQEKADLNEYFNIYSDTEVPIILQDQVIDEKAMVKNGVYYFDIQTVHKYFNDRFYVDRTEELLLYTTPTDIIRAEAGGEGYTVSGEARSDGYVPFIIEKDTYYVAAEYVKKYANFSYEPFLEPNRMQVYTEWNERTVADITKNTAIRYKGGVKSEILTEVSKGDKVTVLEKMETWAKVKSADGFIGYVEIKQLENERTETMTPVTDYVEPEYTSISKPYKINMVWHQVFAEVGGSDLRSALEGTIGVNTVSPTWFSLCDSAGNFTSLANQSYVDTAHEMGLEVWALVDNLSDAVNSTELLSSTTNRTVLIQNLMTMAEQYQLDGINIDFEQVSMEAGDDFIQFIRELSIPCRKNGVVLSVDNYVPTDYTDHYDREEQGLVADYVIIMGYDEHYPGCGKTGSVASINYVENGIADTVSKVPEEKVINAVPFYTRIWLTSGSEISSEAVTMGRAAQFVKQNGIETRWDEETCQNYGEVQTNNGLYQVWLEDAESMQVKLSIMSKYNLAGIAAWKLGLESSDIWPLIGAYVGAQ